MPSSLTLVRIRTAVLAAGAATVVAGLAGCGTHNAAHNAANSTSHNATGNTAHDKATGTTVHALPGLAPNDLQKTLSDAGWAVTLNPVQHKGVATDPNDKMWLKQGQVRTKDGIMLGLVAGGTTKTTVSTLMCQVSKADPTRAENLLAGCAKVAAAEKTDDPQVHSWLHDHINQASQGVGFPLPQHAVTYRLSVLPKDGIRVLTATAN